LGGERLARLISVDGCGSRVESHGVSAATTDHRRCQDVGEKAAMQMDGADICCWFQTMGGTPENTELMVSFSTSCCLQH